ncbi:hypothetical protein KW783_01760 [Candidatus Parcubacteria bacterium]|nr:hypothetical protein [Candidatus Parcubacteria bacterium]
MKQAALLTAFDKTGLEDFAASLLVLDWDLYASQGTVKYLNNHGITDVRDVSSIVGDPILGHKVVTLSRELSAAVLGGDTLEEEVELAKLGVPKIRLVYANLYPTRTEIERAGQTVESVKEKTDIGGPAILRAAAKAGRIVLCRQREFPIVLKLLQGKYRANPDTEQKICYGLASIVHGELAKDDEALADYYGNLAGERFFNERDLL